MIMERPLLSIVVPTKNRYEYLLPCLETLISLKTKFPEVEIVVQDNTIDNSIMLNHPYIKEGLIRYYHVLGNLSQSENCELAISNSTGEYICMLGDDDSVTSFIIDVCKWMKENEIDACLGRICRYNWADMVYTMHKLKNLIIPASLPNRKVGIQDPVKIREKTLRCGGVSMNILPRVYHAIVTKKALDKLKRLCGFYFPGPSPDMANAIGLTFILKKYVVINTPIIVSGFSYKSAGGAGTRRAHVGKIEDVQQLPYKTRYIWDKRIPRYWTAETIYAESIVETLNNYNSHCTHKLSFNALYGSFAMYHLNLINLLGDFVGINNIFQVTYHFTKVLLKRTKNYIKNLGEAKFGITSNTTFDKVNTLLDAVYKVEKWTKSTKQHLSHREIKL